MKNVWSVLKTLLIVFTLSSSFAHTGDAEKIGLDGLRLSEISEFLDESQGPRPTSVDDVVTWEFWVDQKGCEATVYMKATLIKGWHIYSLNHEPEKAEFTGVPTSFEFIPNNNYELVGETTEGTPKVVKDDMGQHRWFEKSAIYKQKIKITGNSDFTLEFTRDFQVCDAIACLFPDPAKATVKVKSCASSNASPEQDEPVIDPGAIQEDSLSIDAVIDSLASSQIEKVKGPIQFKMVAFRTGNKTFDLEIEATPDSSWYLVANDFSLNLTDHPNLKSEDEGEIPEGEKINHPILGEITVYKSTITIIKKITVKDASNLPMALINFDFKAVNDTQVLESAEIAELKFDLNKAPEKEDSKEKKTYWVIFALAFVGGLAALLTPCVFPMIPMTVAFFTKQSKTKAEGIRKAIIYSLSIILIYVLLGVAVSSIFEAGSLNDLATSVWMNVIFFVLFVIFAISFFGAFEIKLPNSWINKADKQADKGGLLGVFFMAFTLALVSFSCTGPIVGSVLVESASGGVTGPVIAMTGFSLALALPFGLFAAFPGWLNSLPQSGGWLTTVKVVLGFLELAFALKFLSNADLVEQTHLLEREVFLALWIAIFVGLAIYLFGGIRFPHDSKMEHLSVGRGMLGLIVLGFVFYMIPGMWGAPLKLLSGLPPGISYSESPYGIGNTAPIADNDLPPSAHYHGHDIWQIRDLKEGVEYARKVGKPVFLDFTGQACVNCRKMEEGIWIEEEVNAMLRDKFVVISLFADERTDISDIQREAYKNREWYSDDMTYISSMWKKFQEKEYKEVTQPMYAILDFNENTLNGTANYQTHNDADDFASWLKDGLEKFELIKNAEIIRPKVISE